MHKKCFHYTFVIYLGIDLCKKKSTSWVCQNRLSIFESFFKVSVFPLPLFVGIIRFRAISWGHGNASSEWVWSWCSYTVLGLITGWPIECRCGMSSGRKERLATVPQMNVWQSLVELISWCASQQWLLDASLVPHIDIENRELYCT